MEQGTLSLALRNPLDTGDADRDQVSLRSILGIAEEAPAESDDDKPPAFERSSRSRRRPQRATPPKPAPPTKLLRQSRSDAKSTPKWETTVIRGDKSQTYSFESAEAGQERRPPPMARPTRAGETQSRRRLEQEQPAEPAPADATGGDSPQARDAVR